MDVDEKETPASKEGSAAPNLHDDDELQDEEESSSKNHDNLIVQYIDVLGRVCIEGPLKACQRC
jgi:hypothetical protein